MKRYGEKYKLDQAQMDVIAAYMDEEIREHLHFEMAPCEPEEFLLAYVERVPEFEEVLRNEFGIEL